MRRIILFLSAAVTLICPGCFKDVSDSTNYVLKPLVQNLSADPNNPLEGVLAYAFVADTALYTVASYEDALNGVVTSRTNSSDRLDPVATSEPCEREGTTGWIQMLLTGSSKKMIVAVDPTNRLYAYTQQEMSDNLPNLYVTLIFKLWKEGFAYKDGNWVFRNDYYTPAQVGDLLPLAFGPERRGRRAGLDREARCLCLCRRYDGVVHRFLRRCRGGQDYLQERRLVHPYQSQFPGLQGIPRRGSIR